MDPRNKKLTPPQAELLKVIPDGTFITTELKTTSRLRSFISSLVLKGHLTREYCIDPGNKHTIYCITIYGKRVRNKLNNGTGL